MDLLNVNSVEELKKYGKFNEIKKKVNKQLGNRVKVNARGWVELFEAINDLNRFIERTDKITKVEYKHFGELNNKNHKQLENEVDYFKSEIDKLVFYLLELDGEARLDKLGITSFHYKNQNYAKKWWKELSKKLHPDVCPHKKSEEANKELNKLYEGMRK